MALLLAPHRFHDPRLWDEPAVAAIEGGRVLGRGYALNTVDINAVQFLWAVVPAVCLLLLWVLGKLITRQADRASSPAPSGVR